jgi:hypothetical protein
MPAVPTAATKTAARTAGQTTSSGLPAMWLWPEFVVAVRPQAPAPNATISTRHTETMARRAPLLAARHGFDATRLGLHASGSVYRVRACGTEPNAVAFATPKTFLVLIPISDDDLTFHDGGEGGRAGRRGPRARGDGPGVTAVALLPFGGIRPGALPFNLTGCYIRVTRR